MWEDGTDRVDQASDVDVSQYVPMITGASLVSGRRGFSLDFSCSESFLSDRALLIDVRGGEGRIFFSDGRPNYYFEPIPDLLTAHFLNTSHVYHLGVVNSRVEYDSKGNLINIQFPDAALEEPRAELTGTLSAVFQKLANEGSDLLSLMDDDAVVLLRTNAEGVLFRVYDTRESIREVFEIRIPTQGEASVKLLSSPSDHRTESCGEKRKLRVIALMENYQGSLTTVATDYLKSVAKGFDEGLRHWAGKFGRVGESGIYRSQVYRDTLVNNVLSSGIRGGVLVGGIRYGLDIYDRYKRDGVLPYQYSDEEFHDFVKTTAGSGLRGGLSSMVTFNLSRKIPSVLTGAAVGIGNMMYDRYQKGSLDKFKLSDAAHTGAESISAAAGAWLGACVGAYVPLPAAVPLGTLSGSIIGHYLYDAVISYDQNLVDSLFDGSSFLFLSFCTG